VLYTQWFVSFQQSLYYFLLFVVIDIYFCHLLFPFVICTGTCTYEYWSSVQWKGNSFNWSSLAVACCQTHTLGYNVLQYCRSFDSLSQLVLLAGLCSLCQNFMCEVSNRKKEKCCGSFMLVLKSTCKRNWQKFSLLGCAAIRDIMCWK